MWKIILNQLDVLRLVNLVKMTHTFPRKERVERKICLPRLLKRKIVTKQKKDRGIQKDRVNVYLCLVPGWVFFQDRQMGCWVLPGTTHPGNNPLFLVSRTRKRGKEKKIGKGKESKVRGKGQEEKRGGWERGIGNKLIKKEKNEKEEHGKGTKGNERRI